MDWKKYLITMVVMLLSFNLYGQDVVSVEPGYGTLNDAVAQNGGDKIYKLKAGGWYGLNAILETPSEPIQIIGEEPESDEEMYAMIQTGSTSEGVTFKYMFNIMGDITMKRVFLVSADLYNSVGAWTLKQSANAKVVLDSIVVDPVGWQCFLHTNADKKETYITNSTFLRAGNNSNPWDGWFIYSEGTREVNWDTLYIENNTIVNVPLFFYYAENFASGVNDFVWINHNSIFYAKSELKYSYLTNSDYFTNNLIWQGCFDPFVNTWNETRVDGSAHALTSLHCADTLSGETFPSERKAFVEYNFNTIDQRINDILSWASDSGFVAYLRPLVMPESMRDSSRESQIFNDDDNFPYFKADNNIEYIPNNEPYIIGGEYIDPNFTDQTIYAYTDSVVSWKDDSFRMQVGLSSYPEATEWPNILYTKEEDGHSEGNPTIWPRFNGEYMNSVLQTASIEGLPLGDLNWFPEAKEKWESEQDEIMDHILGLNESKYTITSVEKEDDVLPERFTLSQNYPNPFNPSTTIKYTIPENGMVTLKVYNVLGQEVARLVNEQQTSGSYIVSFDASELASGLYIYKLQSGNFMQTKKMMLLK